MEDGHVGDYHGQTRRGEACVPSARGGRLNIAALPDTSRNQIIGKITDTASPPVAEIREQINAAMTAERLARAEKQHAAEKARKAASRSPGAQKAAERRAEKWRKEKDERDRVEAERLADLKDQASRWIEKGGPTMAAEIVQALRNDRSGVAIAFKEAALASLTSVTNRTEFPPPAESVPRIAPDCDHAEILEDDG